MPARATVQRPSSQRGNGFMGTACVLWKRPQWSALPLHRGVPYRVPCSFALDFRHDAIPGRSLSSPVSCTTVVSVTGVLPSHWRLATLRSISLYPLFASTVFRSFWLLVSDRGAMFRFCDRPWTHICAYLSGSFGFRMLCPDPCSGRHTLAWWLLCGKKEQRHRSSAFVTEQSRRLRVRR